MVRYVAWVGKVLHSVREASLGSLGSGVGLVSIATALGFDGLTDDAFVAGNKPARALMTAMYDLDKIGLVEFENVGHGNVLTPNGRDVTDMGLASVWPEIFAIPVSEAERTFLARLCAASSEEGDGWADLAFVDADLIYAGCGFPTSEYADTIARFQFYGDLERKGLVRAERHALGSPNTYRPTYLAAVLASEPDPRHGGARAGLIDWSVPTPGFEAIEASLADLKVKLDGAVTDADLSDVGLRCRRLLVDVMQVVYRGEMVPPGTTPPSPQDADEMLRHYLATRLPGKDHEEYRRFLRGTWALAGARVHADRTGRVSAVAAAQGTMSFLRAVQAIERMPRDPPDVDDRVGLSGASRAPAGPGVVLADADAVRTRLMQYLVARRDWEASAWRRMEAARSDGSRSLVLDAIEGEYKQLLRTFIADANVEDHPAGTFGDPPSVTPEATVIRSVEVSGKRAVIVTAEPDDPLLPARVFEYEWRLEDGEWRLVDRSSRDGKGRRIKGLF